MLGSIAIAVNSLAGPAILQLPATYQESGILPTTIALVLVGMLSSFCSLHMANVVSQVPGNSSFDKEVRISSKALSN
jgi:amino acid permease